MRTYKRALERTASRTRRRDDSGGDQDADNVLLESNSNVLLEDGTYLLLE
jgi:hypothetical protein